MEPEFLSSKTIDFVLFLGLELLLNENVLNSSIRGQFLAATAWYLVIQDAEIKEMGLFFFVLTPKKIPLSSSAWKK